MKPVISRLVVVVSLFISISANAAVTLPKIFTDNMVLQRDKPLKIWGNANKGETVAVTFNGQTVKSKADKSGAWLVTLAAMKYGGPFDLSVTTKSGNVTFKNVLIGDVWICSGQSNMEWIVRNTNNAAKEIAESNYPSIRLFTVKKSTSYIPQKDFTGGEWLECNPKNIGDFSAVAYFFGRKLNKDIDVPIGLIIHHGWHQYSNMDKLDVMGKEDEYKNVDLTKYEESAKKCCAESAKIY